MNFDWDTELYYIQQKCQIYVQDARCRSLPTYICLLTGACGYCVTYTKLGPQGFN